MTDPNRAHKRKTLSAILLLAGLSLAWGASWPTMKTVVGELPIYTFRMLTAWGGGACVLLMTALAGNALLLHKRDVAPTIIAAFFNITGWLYFTAVGLTLLPAGRAVVLAYTMPLWAFLAGIVLSSEPVTRRRVFSLLCGLAAVLVLAGDDLIRVGQTPFIVLAILSAAASWGTGTVIQKKVTWHTPLFTVAAWQLLIGGTPLAILAFLFDSAPYANLTWRGALGMTYVILIATVFGYWAWFRIVRLVPTSVASLGTLPIPLLGVSLSMLTLGEPLGWPELGALVLATASLATILPLPRFGRRQGARCAKSGRHQIPYRHSRTAPDATKWYSQGSALNPEPYRSQGVPNVDRTSSPRYYAILVPYPPNARGLSACHARNAPGLNIHSRPSFARCRRRLTQDSNLGWSTRRRSAHLRRYCTK